MGTSEIAAYASMASAMAAGLSALFAIIGVAAMRTAKRADTIAWCMKSYYELQSVAPGVGVPAISPQAFFQRLWGLQLTQYHFYKRGLLPADLYGLWLWARHREIHGKAPERDVGGITFEQGWREIGRTHVADPDFIRFIEIVLARKEDEKPEIMYRLRYFAILELSGATERLTRDSSGT
jgi:hypothetical protein